MNRQQALFILSFLSTLSVLILTFHWVREKLRDAGYDISRIILIGLEPKSHTTTTTQMSFGITNQLIALALAVASTAFIFIKFGSPSSAFVVSTTLSSSLLTRH